ncbi:hypothetical protein GCM10028781_11540 [Nostocoides australiense]
MRNSCPASLEEQSASLGLSAGLRPKNETVDAKLANIGPEEAISITPAEGVSRTTSSPTTATEKTEPNPVKTLLRETSPKAY